MTWSLFFSWLVGGGLVVWLVFWSNKFRLFSKCVSFAVEDRDQFLTLILHEGDFGLVVEFVSMLIGWLLCWLGGWWVGWLVIYEYSC